MGATGAEFSAAYAAYVPAHQDLIRATRAATEAVASLTAALDRYSNEKR